MHVASAIGNTNEYSAHILLLVARLSLTWMAMRITAVVMVGRITMVSLFFKHLASGVKKVPVA
jgi:hypothetical protein